MNKNILIFTTSLVLFLFFAAFFAFKFFPNNLNPNTSKIVTDKNVKSPSVNKKTSQRKPEVYIQDPTGVGNKCEYGFTVTAFDYSCNALTASKTSAKVGDVINFTLNGQTNDSAGNSVFNKARFRVNGGSWTNIPDTTHPFNFSYTLSSSDGDTVNFVAQVGHGDPTLWSSGTGCAKTITVTHDQLSCVEITSNLTDQNIVRGSDVTFSCEAQGTLADHADFQMLLNNNVTNDATSGVAFNNQDIAVWRYHVDESATAGTYLAQCRVCDANDSCTAWGRSEPVTVN